ncbi:hypothetical protein PGTUg99_036445 [Puccinia graminis f. sp. tritici]|uniref:Uncharacterized protein n=1 Tax=Puccinia graminis f. sp. tritici TaxID=56615 RepID=A0A5B0RQB1_PUCGR|nr:hypothetical protein PGTUg99_036445 [Puccinia graminis f. sp. tritici]
MATTDWSSDDRDAARNSSTSRLSRPSVFGSVDPVFSYYNKPLSRFFEAVDHVRREGGTYLTHILKHYNLTILTDQQGRVIRSGKSDPNILEQAKFGVKRVLSSPAIHGLADHTVFMQPKISWHWIAKPQMDLFDSKFNCFLDLASSILRVISFWLMGQDVQSCDQEDSFLASEVVQPRRPGFPPGRRGCTTLPARRIASWPARWALSTL